MDDSLGGGRRRVAAEELILRTIAAHADSLLRTARRHSMCLDDAQDAYQRAIEIFMGHAPRLDPVRAPGWLHVVVKREAQAIRHARRRLLTSTEIDLDGREADSLPSPDEQLLRLDVVSRSAEALKRLKPHELRALWLRAQGHSYSDIAAITGWSYTKVNRTLTEGRRSFLERYEGIESGAECRRWLPVLSALVDGEASSEQLAELRPHLRNCPGCRATLKALQDSRTPLAALLPVPLALADPHAGDHLANLFMRAYEAVVGGVHERAIHSAAKAQALLEASASGKVAAVAASAAAVAGGGYATVERAADRPASASRTAAVAAVRTAAPSANAPSWRGPRVSATKSKVTSALATSVRQATVRRLRTASGFRPQAQAETKHGQATFVYQTLAAGAPSHSRASAGAAARFAPRGSPTTFAP
ncbi:MAG: hypothetical protein QOJ35_3956 [Solirubrobacteraceae bacterium]|nr:hypothetical protein [Solirubrobacteraceae bacterium]